MQTYTQFGWGFSGLYLTDAKAKMLASRGQPRVGEVGLHFVSFSETKGARRANWGTAVAIPLGAAGQHGKLITDTEMADLLQQKLTPEQKAAIVEALEVEGLGHLASRLGLIFYPN